MIVTIKIVLGLCKIFLEGEGILYLGNLYAKRDCHAEDYVKAMWKMLQMKTKRLCNFI